MDDENWETLVVKESSGTLDRVILFLDGHTIEKMRVVWKKGFDQSKVTDNNYISLTQFEYAVFFEENYEEEIASGKQKSENFSHMVHIFDIFRGISWCDNDTFISSKNQLPFAPNLSSKRTFCHCGLAFLIFTSRIHPRPCHNGYDHIIDFGCHVWSCKVKKIIRF